MEAAGRADAEKEITASNWHGFRLHLENDLQGKLGIERLAGADAGSAVGIADGLDDMPGCCPVAQGAVLRSKIDGVARVEHFHPELRAEPLRDAPVLGNRKVDVIVAGPVTLPAMLPRNICACSPGTVTGKAARKGGR